MREIQAPKDSKRVSHISYGNRSLITEGWPVHRYTPSGLPKLPSGVIIKDFISSPLIMISVYIRCEDFESWWQGIGENHEYLLKATNAEGTIIAEIKGRHADSIDSQAKLAELSSAQ